MEIHRSCRLHPQGSASQIKAAGRNGVCRDVAAEGHRASFPFDFVMSHDSIEDNGGDGHGNVTKLSSLAKQANQVRSLFLSS